MLVCRSACALLLNSVVRATFVQAWEDTIYRNCIGSYLREKFMHRNSAVTDKVLLIRYLSKLDRKSVHSWQPTKLQNTGAKTASTIHQLRLGHGYFRAFLARLPNYSSTHCQCSERIQSVKHLLLGCRTYQNEREAAGITRETTLHSLLYISRGTTILQDFIRSTKVATRGWLLQRGEGEREDM